MSITSDENDAKNAENCSGKVRYIGGGRWICHKCGLIIDEPMREPLPGKHSVDERWI